MSTSRRPVGVRAESGRTVLDNRRTPCAVGLIRASDTMAGVTRGTILDILTRDRFARVEIPLWARRAGHSTPVIARAGRWPFRYWVFTIVAGGGATASEG